MPSARTLVAASGSHAFTWKCTRLTCRSRLLRLAVAASSSCTFSAAPSSSAGHAVRVQNTFGARSALVVVEWSLMVDQVSPSLPKLSYSQQTCSRTTEVLERWTLSDLTGDATLIVSELVTNGIEHAGSDLELRLEHGHDLLHIAVRDRGAGSTSPPSSAAAAPAVDSRAAIPERGRGLEIVRRLALASGRTPAPAGGSVCWATLATGGPAAQRTPARER